MTSPSILPEEPPRRIGAARRILRDRRAFAGAVFLAVLAAAAVFAPLIAPYDPNAMDYMMLEEPSPAHPLGVDDLGRDLLSRIVHGARVSLFVGLVTVALALVLGVAMGVAAGYFGGWIDMLIMRYIDLQWAFPNILIAVYLVAVFGTGLLNVIVAISLAYLDDFARVARGMTLSVKEEQYVAAARAVGCSDRRIMVRHILPNITAPVIVLATVSVSNAILAEAVLSGPRRERGHPDLGIDPLRGAQLRHPRLVARHLPRPGDHAHGAVDQLPRRRAARRPRRAREPGRGVSGLRHGRPRDHAGGAVDVGNEWSGPVL